MRSVPDVSLTRLLEERHGPVREFFERRLPDQTSFRARWRAAGPPSILPRDERPPWGQLGAAFDYRMRYFVAATPPNELAAAAGAGHLAVAHHPGPLGAISEVQARIDGHDPYRHVAWALDELVERTNPIGTVLASDDERLLCRLCYLLALYEALVRSPQARATSPLLELAPDVDLDTQLALVEDVWVDDVVALAHGFAAVGAPVLCGRARVVPNPTFPAEPRLNADADLLVDELLLEIKATSQAAPRRDWLYQLLGYALLDYDDRYGIEQVGFYLARVPALITWPLDELLAELAGGPVDRAELRAGLHAAVAAKRIPPVRRQAPTAPPPK